MTQAELSAKTKLSRPHISQIETGSLQVQIDTIEILAQRLEVEVAELFTETVKEEWIR